MPKCRPQNAPSVRAVAACRVHAIGCEWKTTASFT